MDHVYFTDTETHHGSSLEAKFRALLLRSGIETLIGRDELVAIKVHVGERGNLGYVNPNFARIVVEEVKRLGGKPYLTDTNTLYSGGRHNGLDHYLTATMHGYSLLSTGAPFMAADGLRGLDYDEIPASGKHFAKVKVARGILSADKVIMLSHFKGHLEAGFGGSIKNLAMGCAAVPGKMEQHSTAKPFVESATCIGCRQCFQVCPSAAISMDQKKAVIDYEKCIGCGQCVAACNYDSMHHHWNAHAEGFIERVVEYAAAIHARLAGKVLYANFAMNITPDCDCWGYNEPAVVGDVGMLASGNPAALDKASVDLVSRSPVNPQSRFASLVTNKRNVFIDLRDGINSDKTFDFCRKAGMSDGYELVKL